MAVSLRSQSINISRKKLIKHLKEGLEKHITEYQEAREDYVKAVKKFMKEASARADAGDFSNLILRFTAPVSHESEYINVIELMEHSVDKVINLDADAFRAYIKGEWAWKSQFDSASTMVKTYLGG